MQSGSLVQRGPRAPFLLPAGLALLAGLDAALVLLRVPAPLPAAGLAPVHAHLMVLGFVGTVIALERAVALRHTAGLAAPVLLGLGAVLLLTPLPRPLGTTLLLLGALALCAVYVPLHARTQDPAVVVQALGAVLAAGAALLLVVEAPVSLSLTWLVGFVVLTIAGERLELARLAMLAPRVPAQLVTLTVTYAAAAALSLLVPPVGHRLAGAVLLALVGWFTVHDVARRTLRSTRLPRYVAVCLLLGYGWLAVTGALWVLRGPITEGPAYDAVVHSAFLGFTMSMVMAHTPVILPAVLRRPLPWNPLLYVGAAMLHASLLVRVVGGDLLGVDALRVGGSVGNIAAILLFALGAATLVLTAPRRELA
ncbi:hypothetical protein ADJ73_10570 [Arsenicicoccus sp. oral taxon 190]|nr:hypothetical protein ADJ73_10570 [Arsenicicoccus sp. oral taxon 190]